MKTAGFILLGSLLTVGTQILIQSDYNLINKAEAADNPCVTVMVTSNHAFVTVINNYYRQGYRVKGVGAGSDGSTTTTMSGSGFQPLHFIAVMCK